jgi:hypothetical protein
MKNKHVVNKCEAHEIMSEFGFLPTNTSLYLKKENIFLQIKFDAFCLKNKDFDNYVARFLSRRFELIERILVYECPICQLDNIAENALYLDDNIDNLFICPVCCSLFTDLSEIIVPTNDSTLLIQGIYSLSEHLLVPVFQYRPAEEVKK